MMERVGGASINGHGEADPVTPGEPWTAAEAPAGSHLDKGLLPNRAVPQPEITAETATVTAASNGRP